MNAKIHQAIDVCGRSEEAGPESEKNVRRKVSLRRVKAVAVALFLGGCGLAFSGCDGYYTAGYGGAYYEPDYSPYYGDYGYYGDAFPFGGYYGGDIIVGGIHHHGYYGGHHFGHDFHGGGGFHGGGFHGGGFRGSFHGGGGHGHH